MTFLAEIPSDPEFIDTDSDSDDDNIFVPSTSSNKIQIYTNLNSDVENVSKPSISSKKVRTLSQIIVIPTNLVNSGTTACSCGRHFSDDKDPLPKVLSKFPTPDVESSGCDSEDNIPLAQLQKKKPIIWKKVAFLVVPMPFMESHGPSIPDNVEYPYKVLLTLFTEDIVNNIVFQTNLYATQQSRPFTPTAKDETLVFLGINILMGIKLLPSYKDYWSSRNVIRDNYVSSKISVSLMAYLQENKIYGCGTVRTNHKFLLSDTSEDKILRRGETNWRQTTNGILYTKWKDQRFISFLSNYHSPDKLTNVNRGQKDGFLQVVPCLLIVKDCNKFMDEVDKADMLKSLYEINKKSKKWSHRIFFHFVDVTVLQTLIPSSRTDAEVQH
ncbi:hypothetical protein ILUMI_10153 [Ignelater luminosus]|uniref:PiggyBac transposable element-derived protein domain-containing protein n=1 Tax=Ignelater luminosus TaxID=2038154 RepID=A0A8K0GF92_IGNLU|nr:hypothetical protein ILUMI_10153 [Ignelater luminosus]